MKEEILRYLKETDGFVSGQMLCEHFNVSRTAVWKVIGQLKEAGYEIESVKNRGYRLLQVPDVITESEISSGLKTRWAARPVVFREEVDSTNNVIRKLAEEGAGHGTLAVAEIQNAGKGRRGRNWVSPKGSGIWNSILLRPSIRPENASMLTLVAGLAVCEAVSAHMEDCSIKWPNDVVIGGRKICGILTEMSCEMDLIHYVIVGVGVNVNTEAFEEDIAKVATSLYLETGKKFKRSELIGQMWEAFERYYEIFVRTEDLSGLKEIYNSRLVNRGRQVMIEERGLRYKGTALGIDDEGSLIVIMEDGSEKHVISGEVSVRGILGYV